MSLFYLEKPVLFQTQVEVSSVCMHHENKVLLVQHVIDKKWSGGRWSAPGGKLEIGETPIEALAREVQEELQLAIKLEEIQYLCSPYVQHVAIDYQLHLFFWELSHQPKIALDGKEHTAYIWQPINELEKLPLIEGQKEAFQYCLKTILLPPQSSL